MRAIRSIILIALGVALIWDGLGFVGRSLVLDDWLPFGLHYTTFKFAMADRSSIEVVGYGLAAFGAVLAIIGITKPLFRR